MAQPCKFRYWQTSFSDEIRIAAQCRVRSASVEPCVCDTRRKKYPVETYLHGEFTVKDSPLLVNGEARAEREAEFST